MNDFLPLYVQPATDEAVLDVTLLILAYVVVTAYVVLFTIT